MNNRTRAERNLIGTLIAVGESGKHGQRLTGPFWALVTPIAKRGCWLSERASPATNRAFICLSDPNQLAIRKFLSLAG